MPSSQEILDRAEALLSKRFGGTQRCTDAELLTGGGNAVVQRVRLSPNPFLQERTAVVKYIPLSDAALVREVVAYQFTTSLSEEVRPGPVLLAYDVEQRIIVISDSGNGDTFADLLRTGDEERRINILHNLGQALGLMHAATAKREQDFLSLRSRMARSHPAAAQINQYRVASQEHGIRRGLELLRQAGITVPDAVEKTARQAMKRLRGGQRAFTPFDLSPDNIIVAERTHFLDYEWADFRDTAFDLASVVAGFPQFLSARPISDDEADAFIDAWAREVSELWPEVRDEAALRSRLVTALVGLALGEVTAMHLGTSHNLVHEVALAAGDSSIGLEEDQVLPVERLLRPACHDDFDRDEAMIRRDLYETFDALHRYSAREGGPVAEFAREVVGRLNEEA
ncbi:phosphotransferase family protein [Corynebacterium lowii]|uniref:Phosphotransferase enzyme family protein n=1 Tax=Corynebacterium lowii TaxID=1544413 RepID=A0A0Q1AGR8_9CORY|nr:phosphotransferase [Corynebacterium lowii]KQB85853.1 Phosphotransferase enzyme family protein [Corynebacterium lowii]MDP9851155.1 tRNA A-37 threonylcarbamoyl transferase component Bud32 [Corynebacterium lowii]